MSACEALEGCAATACRWSCHGQRDFAHLDCAAELCPEATSVEPCSAECHLLAGECPLTPDCHPNDCNYAEMLCMVETCHPCEETRLVYAYADSCEIHLPGPVPGVKRSYSEVEVEVPDYSSWALVEPPDDCELDPWVGGIWLEPDFDRISLCPEACEAFADAGELFVILGSPPCE